MTTDMPAALEMAAACELLGISSWTGYELVKRDDFPVPVLHLGRAIRIPTRPLLDLLGIDPERPIAGVAAPATQQTAPAPCQEAEENSHHERTSA